MSTKHTPGPWPVSKQYGGLNRYCRVIHVGPVEIHFTIGYDLENDAARQTEAEANASLIAAAPELNAIASNFEITGPDADGLVWLVLHGNGTSGKAMFNLGSADRLAAQVALHFEADRRAAIAKATGSN